MQLCNKFWTGWFQVDQFSNINLVALCQKLKSATSFVIYTHTCMKLIYLNILIEKYLIFIYYISIWYFKIYLKWCFDFKLNSNFNFYIKRMCISETDTNWNVYFSGIYSCQRKSLKSISRAKWQPCFHYIWNKHLRKCLDVTWLEQLPGGHSYVSQLCLPTHRT